MAKRTTGEFLNKLWQVGADHALYIHDGHWYHQLLRFPGALFDRNGYILFPTKESYVGCPHLSIGKQIHVPQPGISAIPGYIRVVREKDQNPPFSLPEIDLDIHNESRIEGRQKLVWHLQYERDRKIVLKKKRAAHSLDCEICGFSFARAYGSNAEKYCEVHHLIPLSRLETPTETRIGDLAIVCANCHRVIHLRNPPYALDEVRNMLQGRRN